jgi:hypothetical protein
MPLLPIESPEKASDQPSVNESQGLWKRIIKQALIAIFASGVLLLIYLMIVNDRKQDEIVGKYAYTQKDGSYVGVIQGRAKKSGVKVFIIKQITGSTISMSESYVVVKDDPPNYDGF